VSAYGKRILHAGDTLWHGYWWRTAEEHWPVDIALLPINVVLGPFPRRPGSVRRGRGNNRRWQDVREGKVGEGR